MGADLVTETGILGSDLLAEALMVPSISAISLLRSSREILTQLPWSLLFLALRERAERTRCARCQQDVYLLKVNGRGELVDYNLTTVKGRLVVPFHRCEQSKGGSA